MAGLRVLSGKDQIGRETLKQTTLESPLWEGGSFYLIDSLSIILLLLLLSKSVRVSSREAQLTRAILAIFITISPLPSRLKASRHRRPTRWSAGVKLIELEELVGSNFFGAVIK